MAVLTVKLQINNRCERKHGSANCIARASYKNRVSVARHGGAALRSVQCAGVRSAAAAAAAAAATAAAPPAVAHPLPTQDPQVIYHALLAPLSALAVPITAWLGGEGSMTYYLATRFAQEVVAVAAAALVCYWLVTLIARSSAETFSNNAQAAKRAAAGSPASATSSSANGGAGGSGAGGELFSLAANAMTGPLARSLFSTVLVINVLRNTTYIIDGFITKFNPTLPTDWLDDLVRLIVQSLTPLDNVLMKLSLVFVALWGGVVLARVKDILLALYLLPQLEALDKGQELVQNFVNPASTLVNWLLGVATVFWVAMAVGMNLQPVLAVGGASTIVLGLATQQVASNFVSGLNIFFARPFVAGDYINLVSASLTNNAQVSGRVIRVDPMRTLIATEDQATIAVPNQVIATSIVINRSRPPHWSVGKASPLLANPRELRWRMKLPHSALDKIEELESQLEEALAEALPEEKVRFSPSKLLIVKFVETGAEVSGKVNLVWRLGTGRLTAHDQLERMDTQEEIVQRAMLSLQRVTRSFDGVLYNPA